MKRAFDIEADHLTPAELIRKLLTAPSRSACGSAGSELTSRRANETHAEVGDRANDALRVNGDEIRAKVVGEGANLGVTQRGRVAFALAGGRIDTDAIDNSAGVDISDHEVNIKILLDQAIASGALAAEEREPLLAADGRRGRRAGVARQLPAGRGAVGRGGARRRRRSIGSCA